MLPLLLADIPSPTPLTLSAGLGVWLQYFLITIAIEIAIVAALWRARYRSTSLQRWLVAAVVANVITHPLASLAWQALALETTAGLVASYVALELGVAFVEAVVFRVAVRCAWSAALLVAFLANAVTAAIGAVFEFMR